MAFKYLVSKLGFILICLLYASRLSANVVYTYSGNSFDVISNPPSGLYDTSMSVSGTFVTRSPLAENLSNRFIDRQILAYAFTDGRNAFTSDGSSFAVFSVSTDDSGKIIGWNIYQSSNIMGPLNELYTTYFPQFDAGEDMGSILDLTNPTLSGSGSINNSPGTWEVKINSPVKELWIDFAKATSLFASVLAIAAASLASADAISAIAVMIALGLAAAPFLLLPGLIGAIISAGTPVFITAVSTLTSLGGAVSGGIAALGMLSITASFLAVFFSWMALDPPDFDYKSLYEPQYQPILKIPELEGDFESAILRVVNLQAQAGDAGVVAVRSFEKLQAARIDAEAGIDTIQYQIKQIHQYSLHLTLLSRHLTELSSETKGLPVILDANGIPDITIGIAEIDKVRSLVGNIMLPELVTNILDDFSIPATDFNEAINRYIENELPLLEGVTLYETILSTAKTYDDAAQAAMESIENELKLISMLVKPNSTDNSVNLKSKGVIPIAILSTSTLTGDTIDFDATQVDVASVMFGPNGSKAKHTSGHIEDIDKDGDLDLLLHFPTLDTGFLCGDIIATITGQTLTGQLFTANDSIMVIDCKNNRYGKSRS